MVTFLAIVDTGELMSKWLDLVDGVLLVDVKDAQRTVRVSNGNEWIVGAGLLQDLTGQLLVV